MSWPREMPGGSVQVDTDAGVERRDLNELADLDRADFDPNSAADALRLMAAKAPTLADRLGRLDPASTLVQSAADLLRAANDWLDHNRTRPFEARAAERLLRALEEGTTIFCDSFVLVLRETATELCSLGACCQPPPLTFPPSSAGEG